MKSTIWGNCLSESRELIYVDSHGDFPVELVFHVVDQWLVGGLVAIFYFPIYWVSMIIPTDEVIFFRGVAQPPTCHNYYYLSVFLIHAWPKRYTQWIGVETTNQMVYFPIFLKASCKASRLEFSMARAYFDASAAAPNPQERHPQERRSGFQPWKLEFVQSSGIRYPIFLSMRFLGENPSLYYESRNVWEILMVPNSHTHPNRLVHTLIKQQFQ